MLKQAGDVGGELRVPSFRCPLLPVTACGPLGETLRIRHTEVIGLTQSLLRAHSDGRWCSWPLVGSRLRNMAGLSFLLGSNPHERVVAVSYMCTPGSSRITGTVENTPAFEGVGFR